MSTAFNSRLSANHIRMENRIKKQVRAALGIIAIAIALYSYVTEQNALAPTQQEAPDLANSTPDLVDGGQVKGAGTVVRLLSDDNQGSRHQRFILELANRQTILIAHNIDLAPRINALNVGDIVEFFGQYEINDRGGVVHWTHHDPQGQHVGGWLKHRGKVYE